MKIAAFKFYLPLLLLLEPLLLTQAAEPDKGRAVGWHWYNEVITDSEDLESKELLDDSQSAVGQLTKLRKSLEEAKAQAILLPTEKNIVRLVKMQNYVMFQADRFSKAWQVAMFSHPELNFNFANPTQNAVQGVLQKERANRQLAAIQELKRRYGLIFFYRGNQPLDQVLAVTIRDFALNHDLSIITSTVDGVIVPVFEQSGLTCLKDVGQAKKLGIEHFPALVAVNPTSEELIPLSYGFISELELRERFLKIKEAI
jgi:type-F conjugative transfer system pilin assembly protein TraF